MLRKLIIVFTALTCLSAFPAYAENTLEKPDYIRCMKTVEQLDDYSREILQGACITTLERYCNAPVRMTTSCLDDAIQSIRVFIADAAPLLPPPPKDLTGFRRNSYARGLDRIAAGPKDPDLAACKTYPKICILVNEIALVTDIFWLARTSKTTLP
ncbi:MAG: hypothetical protein WA790_14990 [Sulfitobacter sp.]